MWWNDSITKDEVDLFLSTLDPDPNARILDLCCGQGRHALEVARRGFKNIEGLDRSRYLIQRAKTNAKNENLPVRFREGDARKTPYPPDTFDCLVILGNSFGYFETPEEDLRVLNEARRILKPRGKLLLDISDGAYLKDNFQPRSWEWIDRNSFVCRERSLSLDGQKLISREVIVDDKKGIVADQFYAERLYTSKALAELLENAGFGNIELVAGIESNSRRGQDLGMMQRRLIITAVIKKEWTPVRKKNRTRLKKVTVILGDPAKKDPLKPTGFFDEDDFYTIDCLKGALREIAGYEFSYLSNHNTLVRDLSKAASRADLVFNLCDEGYANDPRKELHIPAMLEMMDIPYTGSGPQCLAYCYDKSLVRGIARELGIPVAGGMMVKPDDTLFELAMDFPVIVKPNFGDSSFGLNRNSVCHTHDEVVRAISAIREGLGYDKPVLVEEFLTGKDLSLGIVGTPPEKYTVLPISEEDYSAVPGDLVRICGYEAKWQPDSPYWNIRSVPATLPADVEETIVECSLKLFTRLECRDYARFDWRLDGKGNPKLLEVNPNPGWCWDGHLAKMAAFTGITYPEMLEQILKSAEDRLNGLKGNGEHENRFI
jgi:D-alanine-D-alanine ligase